MRIIALQRCKLASPVQQHELAQVQPALLSLSPTPTLSLQVITEHQPELPAIQQVLSASPLATYTTHGSVYILMLLSQFIRLSPSLPASTSPFSTLVSLFLPENRFIRTIFLGFHKYALTYDFFLWTYFTLGEKALDG